MAGRHVLRLRAFIASRHHKSREALLLFLIRYCRRQPVIYTSSATGNAARLAMMRTRPDDAIIILRKYYFDCLPEIPRAYKFLTAISRDTTACLKMDAPIIAYLATAQESQHAHTPCMRDISDESRHTRARRY